MIRNWLIRFMSGRYGPDKFNTALLITGFIAGLLAQLFGSGMLLLLSYIILIYAMFRMLSRNIPKRRSENDRFIRFWWPVRQKIKSFFERLKSRKDYKFFSCPSCKNTLRVPRGKGNIRITCPKCGERFQRKT